MHQYIESVRSDTEAAAGAESYLAGALFLKMEKAFGYEDDGEGKLGSRDDYELVQHKAINAMNGHRAFDLGDEVLSWQASMLRHVAREFYSWWVEYKLDRFQAPDFFSDGEGCMAIESAAEKLGANPTELFTLVLEVEHLLVKMATGPGKTTMQLQKYWDFRAQHKDQLDNPFMNKRIAAEKSHVLLAKSQAILLEVSQKMQDFAKQLAGGHHLLMMSPAIELEALCDFMEGFIDFDSTDNLEHSLSLWMQGLFPARTRSGQPNPLFHSELHHQVINRMGQATQCLVQYVLKKDLEAFEKRDQIIIPFITERLEELKRGSLIGLRDERPEQAEHKG